MTNSVSSVSSVRSVNSEALTDSQHSNRRTWLDYFRSGNDTATDESTDRCGPEPTTGDGVLLEYTDSESESEPEPEPHVGSDQRISDEEISDQESDEDEDEDETIVATPRDRECSTMLSKLEQLEERVRFLESLINLVSDKNNQRKEGRVSR